MNPHSAQEASYSYTLPLGTIGGDLGLGVGGQDSHARSLRLRESVSSQLTISAQSLSPTTPVSTAASPSSSFFCSSSPLSPSHPPFNQNMEKDVVPTAAAGLQDQAPDEQHSEVHPRSSEPPSPSFSSPTTSHRTAIAPPLPAHISARSESPHLRFVAVLMELEPDVYSDVPPPYHPTRMQDAPPGLS
ncbi:hypothetical protein FKP32DRAFT_1673485 [Trametes sanguinea]|nr:hypothetical protein FKP32DRAFT_1673485 [Trametes sanguinea]